MALRRSERKPKPVTIWVEKEAPSAARDPKIIKETARTEKKTALKPIAVGPLPEAVELNEQALPELPIYQPPLKLYFERSESLAIGLSELETFQRLLTPQIIENIVEVTNSYAKNAREPDNELNPSFRWWKSVNSTDIWRYIGCLLYMGYYREGRHEEY
jgi:Transposase IS4